MGEAEAGGLAANCSFEDSGLGSLRQPHSGWWNSRTKGTFVPSTCQGFDFSTDYLSVLQSEVASAVSRGMTIDKTHAWAECPKKLSLRPFSSLRRLLYPVCFSSGITVTFGPSTSTLGSGSNSQRFQPRDRPQIIHHAQVKTDGRRFDAQNDFQL